MQENDLKIKDKAIYLISKFIFGVTTDDAKRMAIIAANIEYDARIFAYGELYEFCPDISAQASIYAEIERKQLIKEIENYDFSKAESQTNA